MINMIPISAQDHGEKYKLGIYSLNVALPECSVLTVPAVILVSGDRIESVIRLSSESPASFTVIQQEYPEYSWEDFSDFFINPGVIDLNACFNSDLDTQADDITDRLSAGSSPTTASVVSTPQKWEGYEMGTRAAVAGGVTTIIETPALKPNAMTTAASIISKLDSMRDVNLYCDIGFLAAVSPSNLKNVPELIVTGVFGFKAYIVPPAKGIGGFSQKDIGSLFGRLESTGRPVFFHPELVNERFLFMNSPFRNEDLEDRQLLPEPSANSFAGAFPDEIVSSESSASPSATEKGASASPGLELERIFRDLNNNHESLIKAEIASYSHSGLTIFKTNSPVKVRSRVGSPTKASPNSPVKAVHHNIQIPGRRPPPIQIVNSPVTSGNTDYKKTLANSSVHWEVNAVTLLVTVLNEYPNAKLHMSNLSTASAVITLDKLKRQSPGLNLTCETAAFYMHFSDENIKEGDTRFKASPPIRELKNKEKLIEVFNLGIIDCVSSYHRPVLPQLKCLTTGNFKRALPGITSVGFTLQTVFGTLNEGPQLAAVKLARHLSENPANIIGLTDKGKIEEGFCADFVVWKPEVLGYGCTYSAHPWICPFVNELLPGEVIKTYVRGRVAYSSEEMVPVGKVLIA